MIDIIVRDQLRYLGNSYELEGHDLDQVDVSLIFFDGPPGSGPRLHRHPYAEVFVVQEGQATFTVDDQTIEATGGQIIVVPPGSAHKFVNSGAGPLRQFDIHCSPRFITEWLEPQPR